MPGTNAVRSVRLPNTKLLRPTSYALLAACRPQELAIEDSIDGGLPCGVFTHYLLATLREQGRGATYRWLHAGLVARIHARYPGQTPMIEGKSDRLIFSRDELPTLWGVNVLEIEGASEGEGHGGAEGESRVRDGGEGDGAGRSGGVSHGEG